MEKSNKKLIFFELALIVASVMVFRGAWMLFDMCPLFNGKWALALMLMGGLGLSAYILKQIHKQE